MVAYSPALVPPAEVMHVRDPNCGLDGIIVIDSTALGPGAGGCRIWDYPNPDDATEDAFRLSKGMSYKNAMAGLPFGGAKAVLRRPRGSFDRAVLFQAFGRAVAELKGRYVTAEDVGTSVADMQEVARTTRHVAGLPPTDGRAGGDPSPWTAQGVFDAMLYAARTRLGTDLKGLTVAVQGTGNVGAGLCSRLAKAGANLVIADIDRERRDRLAAIYGAKIVDANDIVSTEADILAPCALGGALTPQKVPLIKAGLICGGANNQLATAETAQMLQDNGIVYVPDYVANAGGIISVAAEYLGESQSSVAERVAQIGPRVAKLLDHALYLELSPAQVADRMAEAAITGLEAAAA